MPRCSGSRRREPRPFATGGSYGSCRIVPSRRRWWEVALCARVVHRGAVRHDDVQVHVVLVVLPTLEMDCARVNRGAHVVHGVCVVLLVLLTLGMDCVRVNRGVHVVHGVYAVLVPPMLEMDCVSVNRGVHVVHHVRVVYVVLVALVVLVVIPTLEIVDDMSEMCTGRL